MSKTINFLHWLAPQSVQEVFLPKKFLCKQKTAENKNEQKNCPFLVIAAMRALQKSCTKILGLTGFLWLWPV